MASLWDTITAPFTGAPQQQAAQQNQQFINQQVQGTALPTITGAYQQGVGAIQGAQPQAESAITGGAAAGTAAYAPLTDLAAQYGAGTQLQADALGVNGPEGIARAQQAFQASPGYQWQLQQGLQGTLGTSAAAGGGNIGGNTLTALQTYGQGLANQDYQNWLNQVSGFAGLAPGTTQAAASGLAGIATGTGGQLANLYTGTGSQLANLGQGYGSQVGNLVTGAISPYTQQTTNAANAQTAGGANLINLGTNLASLGVQGAGMYNAWGQPTSPGPYQQPTSNMIKIG